MIKQWYALCTKPQHELKVAAALSKKGIENSCPLTRKMLVNNGFRKKISWSPVFPSFVFAYISEAERSTVLRTNDGVSFMYWMGKPAIIVDADIKNMEQFAARYPNVMVERTAIIRNAVVLQPVLPVYETGADEEEIIRIVLPSLGFILTASREKNYRLINRNIESGKTML
ncbi:MAG: transcription termination/antitermination NusG family protein [Bacteroidota bacterium]